MFVDGEVLNGTVRACPLSYAYSIGVGEGGLIGRSGVLESESAMAGVELVNGNAQGSNPQEERIFVSVRLRPLNDKELARNEASDWECINHNTVAFKHSPTDRSPVPSAYSFGKTRTWNMLLLLLSFSICFIYLLFLSMNISVFHDYDFGTINETHTL